jgi:hypothetical protein
MPGPDGHMMMPPHSMGQNGPMHPPPPHMAGMPMGHAPNGPGMMPPPPPHHIHMEMQHIHQQLNHLFNQPQNPQIQQQVRLHLLSYSIFPQSAVVIAVGTG